MSPLNHYLALAHKAINPDSTIVLDATHLFSAIAYLYLRPDEQIKPCYFLGNSVGTYLFS